jgi:hypothetical protein
MTDLRDPIIENTRRSIRNLWNFCLFLPIVYLLICLGIKAAVFDTERLRHGFFGLSDMNYKTSLLAAGLLCGIIQIIILRIKVAVIRIPDEIGPEQAAEMFSKSLMRRWILLLALCDLASILGVLIFLASGEVFAMFLFGLIGLIFYLQCRPKW